MLSLLLAFLIAPTMSFNPMLEGYCELSNDVNGSGSATLSTIVPSSFRFKTELSWSKNFSEDMELNTEPAAPINITIAIIEIMICAMRKPKAEAIITFENLSYGGFLYLNIKTKIEKEWLYNLKLPFLINLFGQ